MTVSRLGAPGYERLPALCHADCKISTPACPGELFGLSLIGGHRPRVISSGRRLSLEKLICNSAGIDAVETA